MLAPLLRWADWLDAWLRANLGRPYNVLLGLGLALGIAGSLSSVGQALGSTKHLTTLIATVVFEVALLINQLAQLHHFREERRASREARRADRKTPPAS